MAGSMAEHTIRASLRNYGALRMMWLLVGGGVAMITFPQFSERKKKKKRSENLNGKSSITSLSSSSQKYIQFRLSIQNGSIRKAASSGI